MHTHASQQYPAFSCFVLSASGSMQGEHDSCSVCLLVDTMGPVDVALCALLNDTLRRSCSDRSSEANFSEGPNPGQRFRRAYNSTALKNAKLLLQCFACFETFNFLFLAHKMFFRINTFLVPFFWYMGKVASYFKVISQSPKKINVSQIIHDIGNINNTSVMVDRL